MRLSSIWVILLKETSNVIILPGKGGMAASWLLDTFREVKLWREVKADSGI